VKNPASGEEVLSCTILTGAPNDVMAELHDRMPVILEEMSGANGWANCRQPKKSCWRYSSHVLIRL
jgi:putative SOS response-associated peptidase YedK